MNSICARESELAQLTVEISPAVSEIDLKIEPDFPLRQ
jgi:hypothetical protein